MTYRILKEEDIQQYIQAHTDLFPQHATLTVTEIGDGNLNHVFRVTDLENNHSLIVKQALPYARTSTEMKLSADRCRIEAQAIQLQETFVPTNVPKIFYYDDVLQLIIMQDLKEYTILRTALMEQQHVDILPKQAANFFAQTLIRTSDFVLDSHAKKQQAVHFINQDLCALTEMLVLTNHSYPAQRNRIEPWLIPTLEEKVYHNQLLQVNSAWLKHKFMTAAECLLHGDAHTGSVFIDNQNLKFFDTEFAFYGPMGFDVGMFLANLLLDICYHNAKDHKDYQIYLQQIILEFLTEFRQTFDSVWHTYTTEHFAAQTPAFFHSFVSVLWHDIAGYCGCEMIRRTTGSSHVAEMDEFDDQTEHQKAQQTSIQIGVALLEKPESFQTVEDYRQLMKNYLSN